MRTLTLDLATVTGYAVGNALTRIDESGIRKLPKTGPDVGAFLCPFRGWLTHMIQRHEIKRVVFEAPILPTETTPMTLRKLTGLASVTEMVCRDLGIDCWEAHMQQIRRNFIGTSKAPKEIEGAALRRSWLKSRTMQECRERGHKPQDDNEGDAIAIFYFVKAVTDPLKRAGNMALLVTEAITSDDLHEVERDDAPA